MRSTRRDVLATGSGAALVALGGCAALTGGGGDGTPTANPPDGPVANAPMPDSPGEYTYATMGTEGPAVTYFGSWKCPNCAAFSTGFLRDIVDDYVESGAIRLRFRGLAYTPGGDPYLGADAPRATRAGLAVWNVESGQYWPYHEQVMAEQPPENTEWATTDRVAEFARIAGVEDVQRVRNQVENGRYEQPLQASADAAADAAIEGTPSLLIDGETVIPTEDQERTRTLLDRAAEGG